MAQRIQDGDKVTYSVAAGVYLPAYTNTGVVVKQRMFNGLHQLLVRDDLTQRESVVGVEIVTHVNEEVCS